MSHLQQAGVGLFFGTAIVILLFVPFVAVSYRRHGGMTFGRSLGWAALVVYATAVLAFTLLPLPDSDRLECVHAVLDPSAVIRDIVDEQRGGGSLLGNLALQQFVLNIAFFVPLGFLIRGLFRRGVLVTTVAGLTVSLAIELTQLTGVWGLYPCAYRLFDTSDLIANAGGAAIGSACGLLLPRGRTVDRDPHRPRPVTWRRQTTALTVDVLLCLLAPAVLGLIVRVVLRFLGFSPDASAVSALELSASAAPVIVEATAVLWTGATAGEHVVLMRAVDGRLRRFVSRPIRLLSGAGGFALLLAVEQPLWAALLVAVSLFAVVVPPPSRGLPHLLSGMTLADRRADGSRAQG